MRTCTQSFLLTAMLFMLSSFTFSTSSQATTQQYTEYGIATYYSDLFEGRSTASGEAYAKTKMTAAHKSLPYGTIIQVTRLDNKKSIQVKVNDRGAFNKGRIIDLSKAAAQKLDMIDDGKANVKIVVLQEAPTKHIVTAINESPKNKEKTNKSMATKPKTTTANNNTKKPSKKKTYHIKGSNKPNNKKLANLEIVTKKNYKEFDLYKIQVLRPAKKGFGVQVGLLENYENVFKFVADLQEDFFKNILLSVEQGKSGPVYRVILGPFPTQEQAQSYRNSLAKKKKINGFVIGLDNLNKKD